MSKKLIIAGVGSRQTPKEILDQMTEIGRLVRVVGGYVRSGHCVGADYAFEAGALGHTIVYLPWAGYGERPLLTQHVINLESVEPALMEECRQSLQLHPAKDRMASLGHRTKKLLMRNYLQVMGTSYNPVDYLVCWNRVEKGQEVGGTAQTCRIARANGVEILDFQRLTNKEILDTLFGGKDD